MEYASADVRFDMAEKAVEDLRAMALTIQEIGSYNNQDEAALKLLILNLANTMQILDPARSDALLKEKAEKYAAENAEKTGLDKEHFPGSSAIGQYL
jgi:hypothetical protein